MDDRKAIHYLDDKLDDRKAVHYLDDKLDDRKAVHYPAGNYLFKVNNGNTRLMCEICSKLTIKTPE